MLLLCSVIVCGLLPWIRAQSPCPGIFDYQNDGSGVYGIIRLHSNGPLSSINIRTNFTIASRLPSNYVGRIEPLQAQTALQNYNRGGTLTYRVHFPVTSPLPRLTSLSVNGQELCYGPPDIPGPGQYVSTISLQHMLYLRGPAAGGANTVYYDDDYNKQGGFNSISGVPGNNFGGSVPVNTFSGSVPGNTFSGSVPGNTFSGSVPGNSFSGSVPVDTQVITVNDRNGDKDTITYYTFKVNRTQSGVPIQSIVPGQDFYFTEQTTQPPFAQRPPQHRPDYNYFDEPSTPNKPFYPERTTGRPSLNAYTTEAARLQPHNDQPPPDYNPYTTEPTQPPQPETPPPDYNPYDPDRNGQGATPKPNIPQVPPRLPSSPTLSDHSECGIIAGGNERVPLIFNGQTYNRGDWPWLVAIYKRAAGRLDFICSGTLISHKHVVTAAHCMLSKNTKTSMEDIVVKVGVYNLEEWGDDITQQRTLEAAVIHESFNSSTLANDILVFTFDRSVEFNVNIRPACLWSGKTDLNRIVGASGVVAGWGRSEFGRGGHGEPRMARIPIVSTAACRASRPEFHKLTSASTLCAGDRNGVGPCSGDSGGGLYILEGGRWRLRGVVSLSLRPDNGDNSCNLNEYLVFTDAAKYLKWIKDIVQSSIF